MGMGKTVSTLSSIEIKILASEIRKPVLVLAPKRVAQSTWPDEAKKWDHLHNIEVQPVIGTEAERLRALKNTNASIFTINYENIPWLYQAMENEKMFSMIVADESTKLKSFRLRKGSKRAKSLALIARHTQQFIGLTGTPSPNGLQDLWGQMWFVDRGQRLGTSYSAFQQRWFNQINVGDFFKYEAAPHAQGEIQNLLKDICLTVQAKDYFDLQEPIVNHIYIDLPSKARRAYTEMEKEMFTNLSGSDIEAVNAGARTAKCHQLANGAAYIEGTNHRWVEVHDLKIQALESIVAEAGGRNLLVAYHFKSDLARLVKAFPRARVLDDDPQTIRDWNAGKINMLLAHPASAGHGLNLQDGGHVLVYFAISWNLENHQQILERIGPTRQLQAGHDRPVYVHYILAKGTVDELILKRLEGKGSVQQILMEAMSSYDNSN